MCSLARVPIDPCWHVLPLPLQMISQQSGRQNLNFPFLTSALLCFQLQLHFVLNPTS